MKIFAINASPRKQNGRTEMILQPFLEGARSAGAETETVYVQGMKIKPCMGCLKCWFKTPGKCIQKDDHPALLEKMVESDVVVYATPLYVFGMTAQMKTFIDRIVPMALPFIELLDGHCTHPSRTDKKMKSMVVVSNCGFHELDNFDEMMMHFKAIAKHTRVELAGTLLRPQGEFMPFGEKLAPEKVRPVFEAAHKAGIELVKNGRVSKETEALVSKEFMPLNAFLWGANEQFKKLIAECKDLEDIHPK